MLTQRRPEVDDKQDTEKPKDANPNATDARTEKCQPVSARRLKVAWRSRVTGAHPLFYSHDPGVDLMQFMQCLKVSVVPGVRLHLLGSGSSLYLTPFKDALILEIKTVMNVRGVAGDVSTVKVSSSIYLS